MIPVKIQELMKQQDRHPTDEYACLRWSLLLQLMAWQEFSLKNRPSPTQRGRHNQLVRAQLLMNDIRQRVASMMPQFPQSHTYYFDIWATSQLTDGRLRFSRAKDAPGVELPQKEFTNAVGFMMMRHIKTRADNKYVILWDEPETENVPNP